MANCIQFVTEDILREIASLDRWEGRDLLRLSLRWRTFDEENDLRSSIILDCLYDNIRFCIDSLFPSYQIVHILSLVNTILLGANCKDLTAALILYKEEYARIAAVVEHDHLRTFTEYFFKSFMAQYGLYEYVMRFPRELVNGNLHLLVHAPPCIPEFKTGKEESIWDYDEKVKQLEKQESDRLEFIRMRREMTLAEDQSKIRDAYKRLDDDGATKDRESIMRLINEVTKAHINMLSHSAQLNIDNLSGEVSFMLRKTSIPRPPELGPPPRYETSSSKEKKPKSAKSTKSSAR